MYPSLPHGAALLVIDVQQGLDDPRHGRRCNPEAEQRMADVLAAWRAADWPIAHVHHHSTSPDSLLRPGQPGADVKPAVQPVAGEAVVIKHSNNAFVGTSLEALLRASGTVGVVVMGLTTEHCVSSTARGAADLGFLVTVLSDATAAFERRGYDGLLYTAETVHGLALVHLQDEFARIQRSDAVLEALRAWGAWRFRPATTDDIPLLRHWDRQPQVREALSDEGWDWDAELADGGDWREMFIVEHAGEPLGFLQVMDPAGDPGAYWGDLAPGHRAIDIWIGDGERLGRGLGSVMMAWAVARCFAAPEVHSVLLDPLASNTRAHRFYYRLGFHKESERQFDEDHCFVLRLTREVWLNSVKLSVSDRPIGGEMDSGIPSST